MTCDNVCCATSRLIISYESLSTLIGHGAHLSDTSLCGASTHTMNIDFHVQTSTWTLEQHHAEMEISERKQLTARQQPHGVVPINHDAEDSFFLKCRKSSEMHKYFMHSSVAPKPETPRMELSCNWLQMKKACAAPKNGKQGKFAFSQLSSFSNWELVQ